MTACISPTARTGRPPTSKASPGATTVIRSASAGASSRIFAATASIVKTGASAASRLSGR